jgi:hypothetical protein
MNAGRKNALRIPDPVAKYAGHFTENRLQYQYVKDNGKELVEIRLG